MKNKNKNKIFKKEKKELKYKILNEKIQIIYSK